MCAMLLLALILSNCGPNASNADFRDAASNNANAAGTIAPGASVAIGGGGLITSGSPTPAAPSPAPSGASTETPTPIPIHNHEFVTIGTGSDGYKHFMVGSKQFFPYGFNYFPNYALQFPTAFPDAWMGADYRGPDIETDLQSMAKLGVNCVTIEAGETTTPPAHLLDVLALCRKYNIRVILGYPKTDPVNAITIPFIFPTPTPLGIITPTPTPTPIPIDPETSFDKFITQDGLASHEEIIGYNIAEEPVLGLYNNRSGFDAAWSRFIAKEFPGIAQANKAVAPATIPVNNGTEQPIDGSIPSSSGIVSVMMPVQVAAGGPPVQCQIVVQNLAKTNDTWVSDVSLRGIFGPGLPTTPIALPAPGTVAPGATATIPFSYTPPAQTGRYRLRMSMFHASRFASARFGTTMDWEVNVVSSGAAVVATVGEPAPLVGASDGDLTGSFLPTCLPASYNALYLAGLFRRFATIECATRYSHVADHIRFLDPNHFISADQGNNGNGNPGAVPNYPVDLQDTGFAFDFQGCENYYFDRTVDAHATRAANAMIQAYSRWATDGKPVTWSEEGFLYQGPPTPTPTPLLRCPAICLPPPPSSSPTPPPPLASPMPSAQTQYHTDFIHAMVDNDGDGVQIWTWAGGVRTDVQEDWGFIDPFPSLTLRPAAARLQTLSRYGTDPRPTPKNGIDVDRIDLLADPRGFAGIFFDHLCNAANSLSNEKLFTVQGDGLGSTSLDPPVFMAPTPTPSGSPAPPSPLPKHLWGYMPFVEMMIGTNGTWFEVRDGMAYAVPTGTPVFIRAQVVNMGDATWSKQNVSLVPHDAGSVASLTFTPVALPDDLHRLQRVKMPQFQVTGFRSITPGQVLVQPLQLQMAATPQPGWPSNIPNPLFIVGGTRIYLCQY